MNHNFAVISLCFFVLFNNNPTVNGTPSEHDALNALMLRLHNDARTKILECKFAGQPQAASMPNLTYDQDLANKAQQWANNCTVGHDNPEDRATQKYPHVGQNFAGSGSFDRAFELWIGEHVNYTLSTNSCKGKTCGHYTQIVWARTESIGCAYTDCQPPKFPYGKSIICNYGPTGNYEHQKPYEIGEHNVCPPPSTTTTSTTKPTASSTDKSTLPVNPNPTSPAFTDHPTEPTVAPGVTTDQPVSYDTNVSVTTDLTTETTATSRSLACAGWLLCSTIMCWIAAFF